MNSVFKSNGHAKYSTKELNGGYTGNDFSVLHVYQNEKRPSVKIQLLFVSVNFSYHLEGDNTEYCIDASFFAWVAFRIIILPADDNKINYISIIHN